MLRFLPAGFAALLVLALAAPPAAADAGCNPAPGFEATCRILDPIARFFGTADAGCHAAPGFEALCVVLNLFAPLL